MRIRLLLEILERLLKARMKLALEAEKNLKKSNRQWHTNQRIKIAGLVVWRECLTTKKVST
jgi:hypothetical protein